MYDGVDCAVYKYVHLDYNNFRQIEFNLNLPASTSSITLEFWFMFMKNSFIGDIITIANSAGDVINYAEDPAYNF